jgi:hypothetical protein
MFATIATVVLIATAGLLAAHLLLIAPIRGRGISERRLGVIGGFVYLLFLLSVAVLAGTSLYSTIPSGHMRGWLLWGHLVAAGAFIVLLPIAGLLWAESCRFGGSGTPVGGTAPRFAWLTRVSFWVLLVAGLISLGTMMASMLKLFDTGTIRTLIAIHRYSGVAVVAGVLLHSYSVCLARSRPASA